MDYFFPKGIRILHYYDKLAKVKTYMSIISGIANYNII